MDIITDITNIFSMDVHFDHQSYLNQILFTILSDYNSFKSITGYQVWISQLVGTIGLKYSVISTHGSIGSIGSIGFFELKFSDQYYWFNWFLVSLN